VITPPAAVLDAIKAALLAAELRFSPYLTGDVLAQAAWGAVVDVCEVREEWGVRSARVPDRVLWGTEGATALHAAVEGYGAGLRRLVITTQPEPVTPTEEPKRGWGAIDGRTLTVSPTPTEEQP
jgi:hypothetical protein